MNRTFIEVPLFIKQWKEIGFSDNELFQLQNLLLDQPDRGAMIEGTGGIRKMRFALPGRGKRSSVRICYVDFPEFGSVYLITVYRKSEKETLTDEEKQILRQLVKDLKAEARKNYRRPLT